MTDTTKRVPALDGLRGLAIISVLAWHYVASIAPWDVEWARWARGILAYAWSGVDLFFVLSGFLIGGIVLDNHRCRNFVAVFYARRALRILPLYWILLAAFATSAALLGGRLSPGAGEWLHGNAHSIFTYLTFGQNVATGLFTPEVAEPGWVNVTWSLAVEEHFYLVVPLAMLVVPASLLPWALGVVVATGPLVRWAVVERLGEASVYVLTPCRVDAIVLGVLCAWAVRQRRVRAALSPAVLYAGAAVLGVTLVALQLVDVGPAFAILGYSLVALFHACVLLLATRGHGPVGAALRSASLQRIGTLAYGLYLLHQPVNGLAHALVLGAPPTLATLPAAAVTAGALVCTFLLAALSWRFVEKPLVALGHRVHYQRGEPGREQTAMRRAA